MSEEEDVKLCPHFSNSQLVATGMQPSQRINIPGLGGNPGLGGQGPLAGALGAAGGGAQIGGSIQYQAFPIRTPCIEDQCRFWNDAQKECWKVLEAQSMYRLAELAEEGSPSPIKIAQRIPSTTKE